MIDFISKLVLFIALISPGYLSAQNLADKWYTKVKVDREEQHYLIDIRTEENDLSGLIDDLSNANFRLPLDSVSINNANQVYIRHNGLNIEFEGTINPSGTRVEGTLQVGDSEIEALLSRRPQARRIQLINEAANYTSEEIHFTNQDGTRFSGTLSLPKGEEACPAVVLISGSGPQDRNSEILGHQPFAVLADHLASRGVAVLRYDDRGYGRSEGQFRPATSMDYAGDARGAVNFLKTYAGREFSHIGLLGHSEGGNIAPVVATQDSAISFMVLLAAPGVSNFQHYLTSLELIMKDYPETYDRDFPFFAMVYRDMATIKNPIALERSLNQRFTRITSQMTEEELAPYGGAESYIESQVSYHSSEWYRHYLQFDVTPYLTKLSIPVLALNGNLDRSVESTQNLTGIERTLKRAGNNEVTVVELENVNHFFQVSTDDKIESVYFNEETFSEEALQIIADWMKQFE